MKRMILCCLGADILSLILYWDQLSKRERVLNSLTYRLNRLIVE